MTSMKADGPRNDETGFPIRIRGNLSNDPIYVINGATSVSVGIHKAISSETIEKQRVRIQISTMPYAQFGTHTLATHTPPFKVMVKIDRPSKKRKAEALTEEVSPLTAFASVAIESEENCQIHRRLDEHACAIEELKACQQAICAELAELGAAIRGDNSP